MIRTKNGEYVADSPNHLIGWNIEDIVGEDELGRTIITAKSRGSGEVRYIHCTPEALPLRVLQKFTNGRA